MEKIEDLLKKEGPRKVFRQIFDAGPNGVSVYDVHMQLGVSYSGVHRYVKLLFKTRAIRKLKAIKSKTGVSKIPYAATAQGRAAYKTVIAELQKEIDEDIKALAMEKSKTIPGLAAPDLLRRVLKAMEKE